MNRRFVSAISVFLISVLCILFLWKQTILLSVLLLLIAYIKHKICPIKRELLWFVLVFLGGAIVEILLVNFGNAWSYSTPQLFNIPIWMPVFWGVIGTTIIVIYDELTGNK